MKSPTIDINRASWTMPMFHRWFAAALLFLAPAAHADGPLPPPEKIIKCSSSGEVCAKSDPATGRTVVSRKARSQPLWSIDGWHRWFFVSNDGESLAVAYDGMSLVPVDSDLKLEVLRFYARGKLVRTVRLGDLYGSRTELLRTSSHLAWVNFIHVNRAEQVVLELVSGRQVALDIKSGKEQALVADGR